MAYNCRKRKYVRMMAWRREKVLAIREESQPLSSLRAGEQGLGANKHVSGPILSQLNLGLADGLAVHRP